MGPKHQAPCGAPPPAGARVRALSGPIGTADTAPRPVPPPTKTYDKAPRTVPPKVTTYDKAKTAPTPLTTLYGNTVTLNHALSNECDKLKQDMRTHQDLHDRSVQNLHAQITDLTKQLEKMTTDKAELLAHYRNVKTTYIGQLGDKDQTIKDMTKTIETQKRELEGLATALEVAFKRPRT
jgi:hypothetical protein